MPGPGRAGPGLTAGGSVLWGRRATPALGGPGPSSGCAAHGRGGSDLAICRSARPVPSGGQVSPGAGRVRGAGGAGRRRGLGGEPGRSFQLALADPAPRTLLHRRGPLLLPSLRGDLRCHGNGIRAESGASGTPQGRHPGRGWAHRSSVSRPPAHVGSALAHPSPVWGPPVSRPPSWPSPVPAQCGVAQVWGPTGFVGMHGAAVSRGEWGEPEPQLGAVGEPHSPASPPAGARASYRRGSVWGRAPEEAEQKPPGSGRRTRRGRALRPRTGASGGGDSVVGLRKSEGPTQGQPGARRSWAGQGPAPREQRRAVV